MLNRGVLGRRAACGAAALIREHHTRASTVDPEDIVGLRPHIHRVARRVGGPREARQGRQTYL